MAVVGEPLRRVLIVGGGTGGHVFPGLAIANVLKAQGVEVFWLGAQRGIENKLVAQQKIPLFVLPVVGLRGRGLLKKIHASAALLKSIVSAITIIRQLKPQVIVGMGGYASGPGGIAAGLLRIPLVLHEQNAVAGMTNRYLAHVAKRTLGGFPHSFSGKKACFVGNPVREAIATIAPPDVRLGDRDGPIRLLVLGGSRGALIFNQIVPKACALLTKIMPIDVIHQAGEKHLSVAQAGYQSAGVKATTSAFIDDMANAYAWADIVIARAGAMTVTELMTAGVASLLIPLPGAVDDHQTKHADLLVAHHAAYLLPETELSAENLANQLKTLCQSRKTLHTMAKAAYGLKKQKVIEHIINQLKDSL
mgnify:CR=1 FL=1